MSMSNVTGLSTVLDWALQYIRVAPVLPIHTVGASGRCSCLDWECPNPGKHPLTELVPHGASDASRNEDDVRRWFRTHQRANLGIRMGGRHTNPGSDAPGILIALDIDPRNGGDDELRFLEETHGLLPHGPRQDTGGGGQHIFLLVPIDRGPPRAKNLCPGVDVKSTNSYVVAGPSKHVSGGLYRWPGPPLGDAPIPFAPAWVLDLLFANREQKQPVTTTFAESRTDAIADRYAGVGIAGAFAELRAASAGTRNDTLYRVAVRVAELAEGNGQAPEHYRGQLVDIVTGLPGPRFSEREAHMCIDSAFGRQRVTGQIGTATAAPAPSDAELSALLDEWERSGERPALPAGDAANELPRWVYSGEDIAKPLPPISWTIPELKLAAGPVSVLAAYGFSGKTMLGQSLLLSVVAGLPLLGGDAPEPGMVLHWDCEQGRQVTTRRYQRMARAAGVDWEDIGRRLLVADHPPHGLDSPEGQLALARLCAGRTLCLVDSLRPAFPAVDENDSKIRAHLKCFARISQATGCTFLLLHHNRKTQQGPQSTPPEQAMRGSSGVFDEAQSVYSLTPDGAGGSVLRQHKDRVSGTPIDDVSLRVVDVAAPSESEWPDPQWGLEVTIVHDEEREARQAAANRGVYERIAKLLIDHPAGASGGQIREVLGVRKPVLTRALAEMEIAGRIHRSGTGKNQVWKSGKVV